MIEMLQLLSDDDRVTIINDYNILHTCVKHPSLLIPILNLLSEELQIKALFSNSQFDDQSVLGIVIRNPDLLAAIPDNLLIAVSKDVTSQDI